MCEPNITFTSSDIIKAPDGSLYITMKIKDKLLCGVLIDLICTVNVIINEHIYTQQLYQYI